MLLLLLLMMIMISVFGLLGLWAAMRPLQGCEP
jgi:hypothetical protein